MKRINVCMFLSLVCCAAIIGDTTILLAADDGFGSLFPGDSLSGWKVSDWSDVAAPQKVEGTAWKIENGVLYGLNKRTWLISPRQYGDFVLKLESTITRGSNGGIGLRFPPEGDPAYKAMEIQVVDADVYYGGSARPEQRTGSIYDEIAARGDAVKPVGRWDSWEITARGSQVKIVLNGQKIIDADLSRETKARQQKGPDLAERPLKGHIGFQNLNGNITLRNIMIKTLDDASSVSQKPDESFVPLFNGKDLDGWVNVNCAPETWTVRDGMIVCTGIPTGVLRTKKQYENYVLELEWRHMKQGGNAGLFIHSDALPAQGQPFTRSIEVQILDGRNTEEYTSHGDVFAIHGAAMTPDKPHPAGWMRSLPSERRCKPAGQWNHYRIESRNGAVTLAVNGKVVTRGSNLNPRKGYICLESEGSEIHFRNIRIHELPSSNPPAEVVAQEDPGFRSLYNGLDLRGWKQEPGHEGHWSAKNWILDYDGKSEASDKNLWTQGEFGNFILIVDWRLPAEPKAAEVPVILPDGSQAVDADGKGLTTSVLSAGDSGIYLRGNSKSQINIWNWPVGSGEIWGYRTDKNMPPEVRKAATPTVNADNPVPQWNRFAITAIGDRVTVMLNAKTVIHWAQLPGIPERGAIALQHHGDPVQFANIFIKELDWSSQEKKIPVVFDTDIGGDIDDTWALIMLLQSPQFDVKLVTTEVGDTLAKAEIVAKILEIAGRTDIPVGVGIRHDKNGHRQVEWTKGYKLSGYPGTVYQDGVQAMIDTIMKSPERIKLVAVGPVPNVAAALKREPRIAEKAEFVGMHGSIRRGYGGSEKVSAEYNVRAYVEDAQKVFTAAWDMTITPLDTCGIVHLTGQKYQKVLNRNSPLTKALIENYRAWYKKGIGDKDLSEEELKKRVDEQVNSRSTTLFDTVGIYLAMSTDLVKMEKLGIRVTDDGYTVIDDKAKVINCATEWKDLGAFEDLLVERLTK